MAMTWEKLLDKDRVRPSTNPGDHREEFERDFDRAAFSTPVKRLQDKAQVFPLEPHDAVRTRLTHSLEVSSVARGLATAIGKWLLGKGEITPGMDRQIEAVAATCGLIHDLGNPPFGHAGEDAIQGWFALKVTENKLREQLDEQDQLVQDFLRFEGNAQTLRLVSKLQILADFNGLNLTFGTLSAACKYVAPSHEAVKGGDDHAREKPGYFASENELIEKIREKSGTEGARNPITFLVEAADDIVYSVADIEDGVKKGILTWDQLLEELESRDVAIVRDVLAAKDRILKARRAEVPAGLPDDVHASAFRTAVIAKSVDSVIEVFNQQYEAVMQDEYHGELVKDGAARELVAALKDIGKRRIYCTPPTLKLELMGRQVIWDLCELFWEGAETLPVDGTINPFTFSGKLCALMSDNYRRVFCHSVETMQDLPEDYHRYHLVTDYACGMTDTFATRLHSELTNA